MDRDKYDEVRAKIYTLALRVFEEWKNEDKQVLTPKVTDMYHTFFATYGSFMEEEYGDLTVAEAEYCNANREKYKSDAAVTRAWVSTEDGKRHLRMRYQLKAIDKIIAALKTRLKRFDNEHYNRQ